MIDENTKVWTLTESFFKDFRATVLLARASEGNQRDFISIVNNCIIAMDGIGDHEGHITSQVVFEAATSWYRLDKYKALSLRQRKLLSEITTFVVQKRGNRGFVMDESYLYFYPIRSLIDARVLHILQTERKFANLGTGPMAILVLDFGSYSQELLTGKDIHFILNDYCENEIFSQWEPSQYDSSTYPLDAERKFRMCFLDPEVTDICPSFFD